MTNLICKTQKLLETKHGTIIEVAFFGEYPSGSLGNRHAKEMHDYVAKTVKEFKPSAVLLDLTNLKYEFGDAIYGVLKPMNAHNNEEGLDIPSAIIARGKTAAATKWLYSFDSNIVCQLENKTQGVGLLRICLAVEPIIQALRDEDWQVRRDAAETLLKIRDYRVIKTLIQATKDEKCKIQQKAAVILPDIGYLTFARMIGLMKETESTLLILLNKALKGENRQIRKGAKKALVEIGGPRVIKSLIQGLRNEQRKVRKNDVLYKIRNSKAAESLIHVLMDEEWIGQKPARGLGNEGMIAFWVAEALGRMIDLRAVEPLSQALTDREWQVREKAAATLGKTGDSMLAKIFGPRDRIDSRVVQSLNKALWDEKCEVGKNAARSLIKIQGVRAVEAFIRALKDKEWEGRKDPAEALGKTRCRVGDSRAREALTQALRDEKRQVREKAEKALKKISASIPEDPYDYHI